MNEFLDAVFDLRFRFGVPHDTEATVSVWGAEDFCWSCGAQTVLVSRIEVSFGPHMTYFALEDFGKHSALVPVLLRNLPQNLAIGAIKPRYSGTREERYLSNGCAHCDALQGAHFVFVLNSEARILHSFPVRIDQAWRRAIESHWFERWAIYEPRILPE